MKTILLINVKMPTIVGILTFTSRINTTSESCKARKILIVQHFKFLRAIEILCSVESSMNFYIIFYIIARPNGSDVFSWSQLKG